MRLINLKNAGFKYSGTDKWVFRHFNLQIEPGETIRIVGRNGTGKSTLLKILSGLLTLTEGTFEIGSDFKVAYMDQFSGNMLARDLTIAEQLKLVTKSASAFTESIETLAKFGLGLQDRADEFIGHLSGGQRQIIALLCTLASGADALCLDEFSSSMDERSIEVADKLLFHAKSVANVTFILVSHWKTNLIPDRELDITLAADSFGSINELSKEDLEGN